eukprot:PITA_32313
MLYDHNLPKFLWAKACNTTVHTHNRIPHRALGKKTPEGVFTGKKPEVSHLRIFKSVAYCHIPKEKRIKLEQTAKVVYPDEDAPLVQQQGSDLVGRQTSGSSIVTSTSISSREEELGVAQQVQEEEQMEPPTTSGRTSHEIRQTLRDAEEFIGAPRAEKRQHRQPDRYQALVAQVEEPSSFQEAVQR